MSLVLWLPLNGNLENKGISQMPSTFTSVNAVYSTGKTTALAYDTSIPSTSAVCPELVGLTTFSVAYWAKIKEGTFSNWADLWALIATTNGQSAMRIRAERQNTTYPDREGLYMTKDTTMGGNTNNYYGAGTIDTQYKWYHTVMVKTPQQVKIYRNGVLTNTRDCSTYEIAPVTLTGTVVLGLAGSEAYLNDFRVYNHALSAAEVKELAKGLILHYKLDNNNEGNPNLAPYSSDFSNWTVGTGWQKISENGETIYHYERTGATSNTWNRLIPPLQLNPNDYPNGITVSFDFKCDDLSVLNQKTICALQIYREDGTRVGWYEGSWTLTNCINGQWQRISRTYTQAQLKTNNNSSYPNATIAYTTVSFQLVQNGSIYIKHIKIEAGDSATNYSLAPQDWGLDGTIVEDSSGYNHNGTASDSLIISANTPRYSFSTRFNGSNTYIACGRGGMVRDAITVNIWAYMDTWVNAPGRIVSCTQGGGWNFEGNSGRIVFQCGTGDTANTYAGVLSPTTITYGGLASGWHMFTGTYDGLSSKLYIDGEFINANNQYTTHTPLFYNSSNGIFLGAEAVSNQTTPTTPYFNGLLSDFRIYCTPLLDTDIKQLYNVGIKVDKSQNIHAFEFAEQDGVTQFKRTGVIETAQVSDDLLFDKKAHIGKKSYPNILENTIDIVTTKDSNIKKGTIASIPAEQMQTLAGKTLRLTYDVCADGDRSSTENGQTAYNYTRYGIHGGMAYTNGSGTTGTAYPFAGFLNYSGPATHAVQTWTVPTGYQTYGSLVFSVQNFDSPASTNNATWFIQNVRLEVIETTSNGFVTGTQLIER